MDISNINPQRIMQMMMNVQIQSNPLFARAQQMAQGKSESEIQQIAQNLCAQRGIDISTAFNQFRNNFGI